MANILAIDDEIPILELIKKIILMRRQTLENYLVMNSMSYIKSVILE